MAQLKTINKKTKNFPVNGEATLVHKGFRIVDQWWGHLEKLAEEENRAKGTSLTASDLVRQAIYEKFIKNI